MQSADTQVPSADAEPKVPSSWTEHTASDGRTFYYDRISSKSTWEKPAGYALPTLDRSALTLEGCLHEPAVIGLVRAIVRHCGFKAVPTVSSIAADDPFCAGGRGGAFCCASKSIHLCEKPWVGCREVAYELSHALNVCRGQVRCARNGIEVNGNDCGYLSPPDVACSEIRAAHWTGRCAADRTEGRFRECLEWHARWAVASCYPEDENLEAHVRWARQFCIPEGWDSGLAERERRRPRRQQESSGAESTPSTST